MKNLFNPIPNAPLVIFRALFGFLLAAESFGAILTGWVSNLFVKSTFSFNHIGFNFLQIFHGETMYFYFAIMGFSGIGVMLGYKYKFNIILFSILWTGAYLMQKESYNNHYYLLLLVSYVMCFLPANASISLDSKYNPSIKTDKMPAWISFSMMVLVSYVYLFSVLAKCYPGWLNGSFVKIMFSNTHEFPIVGKLTQNYYFQQFIVYSGLLFDLCIVPLLLIRKTRTLALILSVFFHIFNAVTLHIGIFPFFALTFILFFHNPEFIKNKFFKNKPDLGLVNFNPQKYTFIYVFIPFLLVQFALPLRHYFIAEPVLWTEEGHRLAWRMMLRSRSGYAVIKVKNLQNNIIEIYPTEKVLTPKQIEWFNNKPDGIWQITQLIKKEYQAKNIPIAIYVDAFVTINGSKYYPFVDSKTDFTKVNWDYFKHSNWILHAPKEFN